MSNGTQRTPTSIGTGELTQFQTDKYQMTSKYILGKALANRESAMSAVNSENTRTQNTERELKLMFKKLEGMQDNLKHFKQNLIQKKVVPVTKRMALIKKINLVD